MNPIDVTGGSARVIYSNEEITQLQREIQSLRQELEMSDRLKDIYIKKFSNVQNALESLKRDSSLSQSAVLGSYKGGPGGDLNSQLIHSMVLVK